MPRRYDPRVQAQQEPLLDYWSEAYCHFFGEFPPAILKCVLARRFKHPKEIPPWTMEDHEVMAATLWKIRAGVLQLLGVQNCWPLKSPEKLTLLAMVRDIDRSRSNLEELMYRQHPGKATTFVYYGRAQREAEARQASVVRSLESSSSR